MKVEKMVEMLDVESVENLDDYWVRKKVVELVHDLADLRVENLVED